jgi:dipeptidyl-peptidase-4
VSTQGSPIDRKVSRAELKNGEIKTIASGDGMHYAFANSACTYIIDGYTNASTPRELNIIDENGKNITHLLTASNPLKDYSVGQTKIFPMKSEDGSTDLYCRMITPPGFDPSKKYPVVVYLYGGPHVQLVTNSWLSGSNLWMQLMAEKGYIVFTMDSRGSGNRGLAFEQTTFRNLGTIELQDQVWGARYLRSLPYVDTARMGVHGWSFGGFMTTSLMTRYSGTFKVAVAGGPVIDWKYYEVMYTERYMDTPDQNPDGYDKANLLNYVKNLKGRLLIIHSTVDPVVVWQHSLMFLRKCIDEGKQVDYFVYPGDEHNMFGKDRVHLMTKVTQYFDDFLK